MKVLSISTTHLVKFLTRRGYFIQIVAPGEIITTKRDGTRYETSLTGQTFAPGCTCVTAGPCKHKRIALGVRRCDRVLEIESAPHICDGYQILHENATAPNGQPIPYYKCTTCGQVQAAADVVHFYTTQEAL